MYIVKIDSYYLETKRAIRNTIQAREVVTNASETLVTRESLATKYSLHFAKFLAEKYSALKPVIMKVG
jgi:outer membrane protein assembly factor BamD (BamD/ComL family)